MQTLIITSIAVLLVRLILHLHVFFSTFVFFHVCLPSTDLILLGEWQRLLLDNKLKR